MSDLAGFLAARLDEQQERAWAVHDVGKCDAMLYAENMENYARDQPDCDCGHPARVLREVAAKRAIAEIHDISHDPCDAHDAMMRSVPCDTILHLAAVYADHPDYDPAWAVS